MAEIKLKVKTELSQDLLKGLKEVNKLISDTEKNIKKLDLDKPFEEINFQSEKVVKNVKKVREGFEKQAQSIIKNKQTIQDLYETAFKLKSKGLISDKEFENLLLQIKTARAGIVQVNSDIKSLEEGAGLASSAVVELLKRFAIIGATGAAIINFPLILSGAINFSVNFLKIFSKLFTSDMATLASQFSNLFKESFSSIITFLRKFGSDASKIATIVFAAPFNDILVFLNFWKSAFLFGLNEVSTFLLNNSFLKKMPKAFYESFRSVIGITTIFVRDFVSIMASNLAFIPNIIVNSIATAGQIINRFFTSGQILSSIEKGIIDIFKLYEFIITEFLTQFELNFGFISNIFNKVFVSIGKKLKSFFSNFIDQVKSFYSEFAERGRKLILIPESTVGAQRTSFFNRFKTDAILAFDEVLKKIKEFTSKSIAFLSSFASQSKEYVQIAIKAFQNFSFSSLFEKVGATFRTFVDGGKSFIQTVKNISLATAKYSKDLFGLIDVVGTVGVGFVALGSILQQSDSGFVRITGTIIKYIGILASGLSVITGLVTIKIGELANAIGTTLVNASIKATQEATKFQNEIFLLTRTADNFNKSFNNLTGTSEEWIRTVEELQAETNNLVTGLEKAATELIVTGSSLGLNKEQMKDLLRVGIDLAAFMKEDLSTTISSLISGLNGNARALQQYGLRVTETNTKNYLLRDGFKGNFDNLSENEKVQARFNLLLAEYIPTAGVAAEISKTLGVQEKILANNIEEVNKKLGVGAAIIESNGIASLFLNKILTSLNSSIYTIVGFFGALAGRILQGIGLWIKYSFIIFTVVKAVEILNVALKSTFTQAIFNASIPFLNKSLVELIANLGVTNFSLTSVKEVLLTFVKIFIQSSKQLIANILGIELATLSLGTALNAVLVKSLLAVKTAAIAVGRALLFLLTNPYVLAITAVVSALYALYKALVFIEEKTKSLTTILDAFFSIFNSSGSILDSFFSVLKDIKQVMIDLGGKVLGVLVAQLIKFLTTILLIIKANPLGIFSNANTKEIDKSILAMIKLNDELRDVGFNLFKIKGSAEEASRGLSTISEPLDIKKISEDLKKLEEDLKNIGSTRTTQIRQEQADRIKIIDAALSGGAIKSEQKYNELRKKINLAADLEIKKERERINRETFDRISGYIADPAKGIRAILNKEISLPNFRLNFEDGIFAGLKKAFGNFFKELSGEGKDTLLAIGGGLVSAIGKGKEGARQLLKAGTEGVVTAFFGPVAGKVAGEIFEVLSQGPEQVKKMVQEFTRAIPELIQNTIEAAPVLVEELIVGLADAIGVLAEKADVIIERFITSLINSIPRIIQAVIKLIPRLIPALIKLGPLIAKSLIVELVRGIPDIIREIIKSLPEIISELIRLLPQITGELIRLMPSVAFSFATALIAEAPRIAIELVKAIAKAASGGLLGGSKDGGGGILGGLGGITGSIGKLPVIGSALKSVVSLASAPIKTITSVFGGGGGGFLGGFFDSLGFAKGGLVSKVPSGFPGDSFPARLTSNELVVSRDLTGKLSAFLNNQGNTNSENLNATLLNEILKELRNPQVVEGKIVSMNNRELGNQMLQISRQNRRTTI